MRRFNERVGKLGLFAIVLVMGLGISGGRTVAWAAELEWNDDAILAVAYADADVRDVLTEILKRIGKDAIFLPGVTGAVTFDFRSNQMPLRAVFNKILAEYNLTYTFSPGDKVVKISMASSTVIIDDIFTPKYSVLEGILEALHRFNLLEGDVTVTPDPPTNSLFLHGAQVRVGDLKRLASQIDDSLHNQFEQRKVVVSQDQEQKQKELDRLRAEQSLAIETQRVLLEKERISDERAVGVKVIPLRYANVGTTSATFQGEKVTLPGIIDSLKAFVGPVSVEDTTSKNVTGGIASETVDTQGGGTKANAQARASETTTRAHTRVDAFNRQVPVISVDLRTNSIIVQGSPQQIKRIEDVVRTLDKPVPLVEIEVMIVDGLVDATRQFGVQLGASRLYGSNSGDFVPSEKGSLTNLGFKQGAVQPAQTITYPDGHVVTIPAGQTTIGKDGSTITTPVSTDLPTRVGLGNVLSSATGLGAQFLYRGTRDLLETTLNALARDGKTQTIASPRVVTLNNLPAKITNANNINFVVTTGDGTKSGIQTVSSGIGLNITPSVIVTEEDGADRLVRLAIDATNSTPGTPGSSSVTVNSQQVQTNVIIPDGSTFVMGGLFSTVRSESDTGIPLLKDIPVMGKLFGSKGSTDRKQETVFFITPKVFSFRDIATSQGVRAKDYMEDQRLLLTAEQKGLEKESQLLLMPQVKVSEDE